MCGVRGTKGPKQRPSVDPELAPQEDSPSRKIGRRINQKQKKIGGSKSRKKKARARRRKVCTRRFWRDIRVVGSNGRESKSQKEKGMSQEVLV